MLALTQKDIGKSMSEPRQKVATKRNEYTNLSLIKLNVLRQKSISQFQKNLDFGKQMCYNALKGA